MRILITILKYSTTSRLNLSQFFYFPGIVNRGDSFRRRRSRSNSLCPPTMLGGGGSPLPLEDEIEPTPITSYVVALLGANGVGKSALISQFMTSEYINAYERQKGKFKVSNP